MTLTTEKKLIILLCAAVLTNAILWLSVRDTRPIWGNVPPAPSTLGATLPTLGDRAFAYRTIGLFLQNLGDTGGRVVNFADFDYGELGEWLKLQNELDPISNQTPNLAAYVYGASKDHQSLGPIIDYLDLAGSSMQPHKWRWWLQAIFLARHRMEDYDRALEIADKLAQRPEEGLPAFTKQMRAFILNKQGDKEAALSLMLNLLKSEGDKMNPAELNSIKAYICDQILPPEEAQSFALCGESY